MAHTTPPAGASPEDDASASNVSPVPTPSSASSPPSGARSGARDGARRKVVRATRGPRQVLDGVLLLDKPIGLSSHDALLRVKGMLRAKKAGHTGTLDPLASGLLPLCFGEATKFSQDLLDADKHYEATMRLGERSDTGDAEGAILETRPVTCDLAAVDAAMARFRGEIEQVPPMYSAIKRDGKPLYEYARAGQTVERAARAVTIHALERLSDAAELAEAREVRVRVHCSKGTYIRTLAEDIGEALGCGAHLRALRRTRVGALTLDGAVTLQALQARLDAAGPTPGAADTGAAGVAPALDPAGLLRPLDALLSRYPAVLLEADFAARFRHGQRLRLDARVAMRWPSTLAGGAEGADGVPAVNPASDDIGRVRVYGPHARLLGTALLVAGRLAPERLVGTSDAPPSAAGDPAAGDPAAGDPAA